MMIMVMISQLTFKFSTLSARYYSNKYSQSLADSSKQGEYDDHNCCYAAAETVEYGELLLVSSQLSSVSAIHSHSSASTRVVVVLSVAPYY